MKFFNILIFKSFFNLKIIKINQKNFFFYILLSYIQDLRKLFII
jgi:hypothetical protein